MKQDLLLLLGCGLLKATWPLSAMAFDAVSGCTNDHAPSPSTPGDKIL